MSWSTNECARRDIDAGADCIWRVAGADWWDRSLGSGLFFGGGPHMPLNWLEMAILYG